MTAQLFSRSAAALFIVMIIAGVSACKKEKSAETCVLSSASVAGTYKLTALKYRLTAASSEQDWLPLIDACEKDDLITLNTGGTWNSQDVGVVCTPNGNDNGTWSLVGSTINSDGLIDGTVTSFDCSTLVFYTNDVNHNGDRLTFTMKKQ